MESCLGHYKDGGLMTRLMVQARNLVDCIIDLYFGHSRPLASHRSCEWSGRNPSSLSFSIYYNITRNNLLKISETAEFLL